MSGAPHKAQLTKSEEIERFKAFLLSNSEYKEKLQEVADYETTSVYIELDDLDAYFQDPVFVNAIRRNTQHYADVVASAIDACLPNPSIGVSDAGNVDDVWRQARTLRLNEQDGESAVASLPPQLLRRFDVRFIPRVNDKACRLREIGAAHMGALVTVRGIVTRVTDVKPLIEVQTYICVECRHEAYQTVESSEYTPLSACPSPVCRQNNSKGQLYAQVRGSKFRKFQKATLQELPTEVPVGNTPRTVSLHVFGDMVRQMKPGSMVSVSGVFLPEPLSGAQAFRAGLTTIPYIDASYVVEHKPTYETLSSHEDQMQFVRTLSADTTIYERLAKSICPEIFGHLNTKKALLLAMVGGVTKTMGDGLRIRGDINVLLVGDPGMAKSQLLKYLSKTAPRCVYTTGKGSSGVGLTAAVIRDPVTGDMTLEGGALVLADQGVCCIDEFDKMEESDRTAIHEVMEQQTVSIAKAGITTTLNARATVIAAANPVYGRFNKRKSVGENLDMPAALLSRFDLVFVMLDKPDRAADLDLARHITSVHRTRQAPTLNNAVYIEPALMRTYIACARMTEPDVPASLVDDIASKYVHLRTFTNNPREGDGRYQNSRERFCTARMLLSIVRLSQALARVNMRDQVTEKDVEEAIRLIEVSKNDLQDTADHLPSRAAADKTTRVFTIVVQLSRNGKQAVSRDRVYAMATPSITETEVDAALDHYLTAGLLMQSDSGELSIVNAYAS